MLAVAALVATVPLAQASCHMCLDAVVQDCTGLDAADCAGSAAYLGEHYPQHLAETVGDADPSPPQCARANIVFCL